MPKKSADMELVGKKGARVVQKGWDYEHAEKVAKTLRKDPDIKSVKVTRTS
jgi:hypothetical protein